jgi:hypothetical protein
MQAVTTIGLDIAKSVFQIHGVDAAANVIVRRELKRRYVLPFFQKLPPCLVGIEACDSSHYRSRQLKALVHTVRLMPPAYVKPYIKRHALDSRSHGNLPFATHHKRCCEPGRQRVARAARGAFHPARAGFPRPRLWSSQPVGQLGGRAPSGAFPFYGRTGFVTRKRNRWGFLSPKSTIS